MSQTHRSLVIERENDFGNETQTEIVDTPQDSIEVSVNAKGEPSWSVKVYGRDDVELKERLEKSRAIAEAQAAGIRAGKGAVQ